MLCANVEAHHEEEPWGRVKISRVVISDHMFGSVRLFVCRILNRAPAGPAFISLCFIVRSLDAVGFAAGMTSSFAMTAKIFPNNVATVLVSADAGVLFAFGESREDHNGHLYSQTHCMSHFLER